MKKRIISLLACGALAITALASAAGCSGQDDSIKLTVWGAEAQQATLLEMAEKFKAANPDKKYNISVGVCGEGDAYMNVSKDPSAAADVYGYSNDQLINLIRCGGVAQIGGSYLEQIKSDNTEESVESGTLDGKVYGYPYAADNGYFMYYDKSVLTEEDVSTLEGIISVCKSKNKKIGWAIDDSWYTAGWFFTFGCTYSVEYNDDYSEKKVDCTFNDAGGIKASKAMAMLTSSGAFAGKGTNNDTIISGFGTGALAVAVTGTWNADAIKEKLGQNYGVCKLPTVTVDGETKQLSSFKGYKLFGVNPHSANLAEAHKLAAFLSGEEMQKERFLKHGVGPSNKEAVAMDEVKANPAIAAVTAQSLYAVEQSSVPSNFWNPVKAYGGYIIDNLIDQTTYQDYLNKMTEQIKSSISA